VSCAVTMSLCIEVLYCCYRTDTMIDCSVDCIAVILFISFLTNSTDFMSLHSAAILTVLCYIVLPSRSGSHTLGIKDTFDSIIIRLD